MKIPKKNKTAVVFSLAALIAFILTGCSFQPAAPDGSGVTRRFDRAEKLGQFIKVNKSVDCNGTTVTIEKILFDKTGTFMIAAVEGEISGKVDPLNVKLFDGQDRSLGWDSFLQKYPVKLPGDKTLLTFEPVESPPESLRLEFSGGPVEYGSGPVVLDLRGIKFKTVDNKYVCVYHPAEIAEKNGYSLLVDAITAGVSETQIHYKITARGDYDGVVHGWMNDWGSKYYSPDGEMLAVSDGGRKLERHLTGIGNLSPSDRLGPSYRVARDGKTVVGRANFDPLITHELRLSLTDVYGYYSMDQTIPLEEIADTVSLDQKIPVRDYTVCLNSLTKIDDKTRTLDYVVLDSAGNRVAAVIDACIYTSSHNYKLPLTFTRQIEDAPGGDRRLLMGWNTGESEEEILAQKPVIKITRLGFKQEDAVLDLNLDSPPKNLDDSEEKAVMAAVNDYYKTLGNALAKDDPAAFEKEYGYLEPTGNWQDGVNDWRRLFDMWRPLGIKEYNVSFGEPFGESIITVAGNTAAAELDGVETISRNGDKGVLPPSPYSASKNGEEATKGLIVVFSLEKELNKWKITRVDEYTVYEQMLGVNWKD